MLNKDPQIEEIKSAVAQNVPLTREQILHAFEKIGEAGYIILVKHDGLRTENKYTAFIANPANPGTGIRQDAATLSDALSYCLRRYFALRDKNSPEYGD